MTPYITNALQIIQERYDHDIKIVQLAETVGVSHHHLCRKFKKEVGMSIGNHTAQLRIERAKELLIKSSLPVGEISSKCGYGSTVQFHRMFNKLVGNTPMQYRKRAFGEG